jgi:class 3 adenylate cyclase
MSSDLEPSVILEMLNTLFTYFDHLTEEYNVEKITTIGMFFLKKNNLKNIESYIGDAYVACSSFNPNANPKTGAISICLVGLQMQSYLVHQLNESDYVKKNVGKPVKMRVGIHTGPAVGAIMGGPRNFRYDLLGDTGRILLFFTFFKKIKNINPLLVLLAEKVQEIAPVGYVNISEQAYEQVKDYHGFGFTNNPEKLANGTKTYVLKAFDDRLVAAHASDFDISAPLKSTQEAAKGNVGANGRKPTTNAGPPPVAAPSNTVKRPTGSSNPTRTSLSIGNPTAKGPHIGNPLTKQNSFITLNVSNNNESSLSKKPLPPVNPNAHHS